MAKRIVWTEEADDDRLQILQYWYTVTGSKTYSNKLNKKFREYLNTIQHYPEIGLRTEIPNVRIKTVGNYHLIYLLTSNSIILLQIWDTRQNPDKLKDKGIVL